MFHPRLALVTVAAGLALTCGCYSGPSHPWFQKHSNPVPTTVGCEGCDSTPGVSEGPLLGDPGGFATPDIGYPQNGGYPFNGGYPSNGGLPPGAIPAPMENGGRLTPQPGVPPLATPPGRLMPTPQAQPEPFRP